MLKMSDGNFEQRHEQLTSTVSDEYLEALWVLEEKGISTAEALAGMMGNDFDSQLLEALAEEGMLELPNDRKQIVRMTEKGRHRARQLIRAHRLAERLLFDVFGRRDYEVAACEFEHILDTDLVDGICTLLGHPRRSPDGLAIPEGNCCRAEQRTVSPAAVPVSELQPGQRGRVISVNAESDQHLHILETLQIRPGMIIRLHQTRPSFVIESEGSSVALDDTVAQEIFVWPMKDQFAEKPFIGYDVQGNSCSRRDSSHGNSHADRHKRPRGGRKAGVRRGFGRKNRHQE